MAAHHTFIYLGSRAVAGLINVLSLAVITRLASAESYGSYLLIVSWSFVLYSFCCQWAKFAFFAHYDEGQAATQIATLARVLCGTLLLGTAGCFAAEVAGLLDSNHSLSIAAMMVGLTVFEGAVEVSRTRLDAGAVAVAVVTRAVLILSFGSATLLVSDQAVPLALATALGNICAAWLPAWRLGRIAFGPGSASVARGFVRYGWPLILSFGVTALGSNVDRLFLASYIGPAKLGAYGAVSDLLKQCFLVCGEAIALSLVSFAKRDLREGRSAAARTTLGNACRALSTVSAFGAAFILVFDDVIATVVFGADLRDQAVALAPYLVTAYVFLIFRNFYFGQVIYFSASSHLDLIAAVVLLGSVSALIVFLVPFWSVMGAALALVIGQGLACLVFILGTPRSARLPVPVRDIALIAGVAVLSGLAAAELRAFAGMTDNLAMVVAFLVLTIGFAGTVRQFNILGIAERLGMRREGTAW